MTKVQYDELPDELLKLLTEINERLNSLETDVIELYDNIDELDDLEEKVMALL